LVFQVLLFTQILMANNTVLIQKFCVYASSGVRISKATAGLSAAVRRLARRAGKRRYAVDRPDVRRKPGQDFSQ
jgi:hypothetical protein